MCAATFGANTYASLLSRGVYRLQRRRVRERTRSDLWTKKRLRGFEAQRTHSKKNAGARFLGRRRRRSRWGRGL